MENIKINIFQIENFLKDIVIKNETKLVLFVMDGLGDIPNPNYSYKTPLMVAKKDNIKKILNKSALGLGIPVFRGITPGSGPGHTALFGFDPILYQIKRGILEVLGMDMEIQKNSIAIRGNWAKVKQQNDSYLVLDRRAGRLPTQENIRLVNLIQSIINKLNEKYNVKIDIKSGLEHRLGIVITPINFNFEDIDIGDNDPQKENKYVKDFTKNNTLSILLNELNKEVYKLLENDKANYILFRGITGVPLLPHFEEIYKLKPLAIAKYPMYLGIAKLFGFDTIKIQDYKDLNNIKEIIKENINNYDFIFFHYKYTDMAGEDGNFELKVNSIEEADKIVGLFLEFDPDVMVITGDHSTPCIYKSHSFQGTPYMIYSKNQDVLNANLDINTDFNEIECLKGELGTFELKYNISLMLAYSKRLQKYGA
ncbi:MAG: phosphoglycerate mutase [bacterium]|nr:phosphoglycerate mutase [bacterium]